MVTYIADISTNNFKRYLVGEANNITIVNLDLANAISLSSTGISNDLGDLSANSVLTLDQNSFNCYEKFYVKATVPGAFANFKVWMW